MQCLCQWPRMGPWWVCRVSADGLTWAHGGHAESLPMTLHGPMMGVQSDCRWPHMGPWQACIGTADDLTWAHGGHAESLPMALHGPMVVMRRLC
jgi:hypothetical protein